MKNQPKFRPSFDGCYNYKKLKDEGLVEEESTEDPIVLYTLRMMTVVKLAHLR